MGNKYCERCEYLEEIIRSDRGRHEKEIRQIRRIYADETRMIVRQNEWLMKAIAEMEMLNPSPIQIKLTEQPNGTTNTLITTLREGRNELIR